MTWATNIKNDSDKNTYLVRVSARIRIPFASFTAVGGGQYSAPFTYGPVVGVRRSTTVAATGQNGTQIALDLTADTTSSPASGKFYYDRAAQVLYWNTGGGAQFSTDWVVAEFYLFFASRDIYWYETPTDATSTTQFWKGLVTAPPAYKITGQGQSLGLVPADPTRLELRNDNSLEYLLGNASFYRTDCVTWHMCGAEAVANVQAAMTGVLGDGIDYKDDLIGFQVNDRMITFDAQTVGHYLNTSPVDPKFQNYPLMKLWGITEFGDRALFEMMNVDYNSTAPTTANNRKFVLFYDPGGVSYVGILQPGTLTPGSSKFTCTNHANAARYRHGDNVMYYNSPGVNQQYLTVLSINTATGDVVFNEVPAGGTVSGSLLTSIFKRVVIMKNGTAYFAKYGRDWSEVLVGGLYRGIQLTASAEANLGIATFDPTTDTIWAYPVGQRTFPQNAGVDLVDTDSHDYITYNFTFWKGVNILYSFLRDECGLTEAQIDYSSFTAAIPYSYWPVYLPLPLSPGADFPTHRDVLDLLLRSLLLRAFIAPDGRFTVIPYKPVGVAAATVTKEEIIDSGFTIDYSNMGNVQPTKAWEAYSDNRLIPATTVDDLINGGGLARVLFTQRIPGLVNALYSNGSFFLHRVSKSIPFQHITSGVYGTDSGITVFLSRLCDLMGERIGRQHVKTARQNLDRTPSDMIAVTRPALVGSTYDGTDKSKTYESLEISKAEDGVDMNLDDLKAANDNSSADYWS